MLNRKTINYVRNLLKIYLRVYALDKINHILNLDMSFNYILLYVLLI